MFYRQFVLPCHLLDVKIGRHWESRRYSALLQAILNCSTEPWRRKAEGRTRSISSRTALAVRGAGAQQAEFCWQATAELRQKVATLVSNHIPQTVKIIHKCTKYIRRVRLKKKTGNNLQRVYNKEEEPFVKSLDDAQSSFNVQRQAYYSGTFVGNHVHRALKVQILDKYSYTLRCTNLTCRNQTSRHSVLLQ